MADNNTAAGVNSLSAITTSGADNVALGTSALAATTSGIQNVALGSQAGKTNAAGASSGNILIGYNVDVPSNPTSNYLNIGGAIKGDMSLGPITLNSSINFHAKTQSAGDNSTNLATTAYADAAAAGSSPLQLLYSATGFDTSVGSGKLDFSSGGSRPVTHNKYRAIELRITNFASTVYSDSLYAYFMNQGSPDTGNNYTTIDNSIGTSQGYSSAAQPFIGDGASGPYVYGDVFIRMFGFFLNTGTYPASIFFDFAAYADETPPNPGFRGGSGHYGVLQNGSTWDGIQFVSSGSGKFTFDWALYGLT